MDDISGVKILTKNDYNYPVDNPDGVARWLLDPGYYECGESIKMYYNNGNSGDTATAKFWILKDSNNRVVVVSPSGGMLFLNSLAANGSIVGEYYQNAAILTAGQTINNLTSTSASNPLSAAQGKVLKGLIDALPIGGAKVLTADDYNYDSDNDGVNDKIYFGYLPAGFYSIGSLSPTNDFCPNMESGTNNIYAKSFIVSEPYSYNWAQGTTPIVNVYFLGHISYGRNAVGYGSLPHETIFVIPYYKESVGNVGNPRVALFSTDLIAEYVGNTGTMKANMPFSGLGAYNMYHDHILPLTGSGAPTASTDAKRIGRTYIDTSTQDVYMCVARTSASDNTWKKIA